MPSRSKIIIIAGCFLLVLCGCLVWFSSAVFMQLFIALALAYILNPFVERLQKTGINRIAAILAVFLAAILFMTATGTFLAISVKNELASINLNIPAYTSRLYGIIPDQFKIWAGIETPERLSYQINVLMQRAGAISPDLMKPLLGMLQKAFSSTVGLVLAILGYLIIPVYLFYLLDDFPRLKSTLLSLVPVRHRSMCESRLSEVDDILSGFIQGQLLVCAILAVLYSIGLSIIGIDLAVAIGVLAGAAFIIPYVGTVIGIILSVIMAFLKFHDLLHPLLCIGWFSVVQGLEGMVITPKVVGEKVGLHPLVAIVSLLIGGQMFGIMGMLIAVPATAVLKVFLGSFLEYYRSSDLYTSP